MAEGDLHARGPLGLAGGRGDLHAGQDDSVLQVLQVRQGCGRAHLGAKSKAARSKASGATAPPRPTTADHPRLGFGVWAVPEHSGGPSASAVADARKGVPAGHCRTAPAVMRVAGVAGSGPGMAV